MYNRIKAILLPVNVAGILLQKGTYINVFAHKPE